MIRMEWSMMVTQMIYKVPVWSPVSAVWATCHPCKNWKLTRNQRLPTQMRRCHWGQWRVRDRPQTALTHWVQVRLLLKQRSALVSSSQSCLMLMLMLLLVLGSSLGRRALQCSLWARWVQQEVQTLGMSDKEPRAALLTHNEVWLKLNLKLKMTSIDAEHWYILIDTTGMSLLLAEVQD